MVVQFSLRSPRVAANQQFQWSWSSGVFEIVNLGTSPLSRAFMYYMELHASNRGAVCCRSGRLRQLMQPDTESTECHRNNIGH